MSANMEKFDELMKGITPVSQYSTGEATFKALTKIVNDFTESPSENYGIVVKTQNGLQVFSITYFHPHTFLFSGKDNQGNEACDLLHYNQIHLRITKIRKEIGTDKRYGFDLKRA